ncbi:hypothetical protein H1D32_11395 [Anaerobacillus sp. CMMVII]|uniref:hypothetical protein n=1 Tax=Anaerobacillus sp. CMMVII TaxID=2755588 RepID=UPI0021B7DFEE|nr:hypothetical protein [Anaerobacillus sp. CMMVII]MCT8138301.1 hypothetical protein [Anaerobacillus sp. CMMVII]
MTHENRKSIFNEELRHLKEHNFIEQSDFEKVAAAYEQYYEAILVEEKAEAERLAERRKARLAEANRIAEERIANLNWKRRKRNLLLSKLEKEILVYH